MLFRIAFMVDQKDVGTVYARLAGLKIFKAEPPQPVTVVNGSTTIDGLVDLKGRSEISVKEMTAMIVAAGKSPRSAGYVVKGLTSKGLIKKSKKRGVYTVLHK